MAEETARVVFEGRSDTQQAEGGLSRMQAGIVSLDSAINLLQRGFGALTALIRDTAGAALDQERVMTRLASTLDRAGISADVHSERIRGFLADIQATTRFGDDATAQAISNIVLTTQAINPTIDEIERMTRLAADFAEVSGQDISQAARLVGRAVGDQITVVERYIGSLDSFIEQARNELGPAASESAVSMAALERAIGGASAAINPMDRNLAGLRNAFGDVREAIGAFIIENEDAARAVQRLEEFLLGVAAAFDPAAEGANTFGRALADLAEFADNSISLVLDLTRALDDLGRAQQQRETERSTGLLRDAREAAEAGQLGRARTFARAGGIEGVGGLDADELIDRIDASLARVVRERTAVVTSAISEVQPGVTVGTGRDTGADFGPALPETRERTSSRGGGGSDDLIQTQREFGEDFAARMQEIFDDLDLAKRFDIELIAALDKSDEAVARFADSIKEVDIAAMFEGLDVLSEDFALQFQLMEDSIVTMSDVWRDVADDMAMTAVDVGGQMVGAFGAAATGSKGAFDDIGRQAAKGAGKVANHWGRVFVLQGLGFQVIPGMQASGGELVGVGAGLLLLGGALGAAGGGGGRGGASRGGARGATGIADTRRGETATIIDTRTDLILDGEVLASSTRRHEALGGGGRT